ncbi:MAG: NAD(P)/FAD-dependent oxidoreductase [Candidatus Thorarchaeota archaeon]|nr:MAG: NAD(P)/FAD-dependent oxidoreductase [Candidatus Thorarchaeota archaeon]
MSGALLGQKGFRVNILERMNFIGGRFTSFEKDGVPIPTGAVHMIPHRKGPMKQILVDKLNLPIELIDAGRPAIVNEKGEGIELGGLDAAKLFLKSLMGFSSAKRAMDSIYEFSIGLKGSRIPLLDRFAFMRRIGSYSHHVTPKGGVKSVIDALASSIRESGGRIRINHNVISVKPIDEGGFEVTTEGENYRSDIVIANCSPAVLFRLLGGEARLLGSSFERKVTECEPVPGIKIAVVCNHRVCPSSITFTPFLQVISGFSEPTIADPELAGEGRHLIMSHQEVGPGSLYDQIERAMEDFREFIPNFQDSCKVVSTHVYRDVYPVNHASQGQDFRPITRIQGLYLVGDGVKPRGYIMTEGVAKSAEIAVKAIFGGNGS